jgi:hypothetical protein
LLPYGIVSHRENLREKQRLLPSADEPLVFNAKGQKLKTFFLKDTDVNRHNPYNFVDGRYPAFMLWDRNNYGLKNHVYVQKNVLTTVGKPLKQFAFFLESESIAPEDYQIFDKNLGLENEFDLIFTHSNTLLNKYKNAVFMPGGGVWYGTEKHGGTANSEQYTKKNGNISLVSSQKTACELHKFRLNLALYYKNNPKIDTFGTFNGGTSIKISSSLETYRYSIVIENVITPYYFTEKILNCFAAMTIPIYIGASKISDFFNINGIIQISSPEFGSIDKIINTCNESDYLNRLPAIQDNFERVQQYLCVEDYIYTHYQNSFA